MFSDNYFFRRRQLDFPSQRETWSLGDNSIVKPTTIRIPGAAVVVV
jgi:hypothetical protein